MTQKLLLFFFISLVESKDVPIKILNLTCNYSTVYFSYGLYEYKQQDEYTLALNFTYDVAQILSNLEAVVEIKLAPKQRMQKSRFHEPQYFPFLKLSLNICAGALKIAWLKPFLAFAEKYTNYLSGCPYKPGRYYARNIPFTVKTLSIIAPPGLYKCTITLYANKNKNIKAWALEADAIIK